MKIQVHTLIHHIQSHFDSIYYSQVGGDKKLLGVLLCDLLIAFIHEFLFLNPEFSWLRVSFLCFHKNDKSNHKKPAKARFILIGMRISWKQVQNNERKKTTSNPNSKYIMQFKEGSCVIFSLWANPNCPHMFCRTLQ